MADTSIKKVVVVVDLSRYRDISKVVEKQLDEKATGALNEQIKQLIESGLAGLSLKIESVPHKWTGDGAIIAFDKTLDASDFAEHLHLYAKIHNSRRGDPLAERHFRVGIARGNLLLSQKSDVKGDLATHDVAGTVVADAVSLEGACTTGEVLIGADAWADLPEPYRALYGGEEVVPGKRKETFRAHRRRVVPPAPWDEVAKTARVYLWVALGAAGLFAVLTVAAGTRWWNDRVPRQEMADVRLVNERLVNELSQVREELRQELAALRLVNDLTQVRGDLPKVVMDDKDNYVSLAAFKSRGTDGVPSTPILYGVEIREVVPATRLEIHTGIGTKWRAVPLIRIPGPVEQWRVANPEPSAPHWWTAGETGRGVLLPACNPGDHLRVMVVEVVNDEPGERQDTEPPIWVKRARENR